MLRILLPAFAFATPALADTDGYGHMMGGGYGYDYGIGMLFGPVLWLIVLGLIVAGVIWFVRRLDGDAPRGRSSSARAELDLRFARGEIDEADYLARKRHLDE